MQPLYEDKWTSTLDKEVPCKSFLHTFNMKNMHSQNRLEVELLCSCSLTSEVVQCNAMKFTKNLMRCVHSGNTKTLWENCNSPWWNVKGIVVRTRVNHSAWDHRLSPNSHALAIYLEFVPTCEAAPERFEECQCENDDVRLHCRIWVLGDGHYCWLRGPINPLFHGASNWIPSSHHSSHFGIFAVVIIPLKSFTKL